MLLTVGLEVHVKLATKKKLFCGCVNAQDFDVLVPNSQVCPVCTAQPGALPVLNREAWEKFVVLGRALGAEISREISFDRKQYFYPDLPAGFQITQFFSPGIQNWGLKFWDAALENSKTVGIREAHLETDTAKMIHDNDSVLLDFNRAGTPLVEIVTAPDFDDADDVLDFLKELQRLLRVNEISDADLEKGQLRVDVNVSIRENLADPLGTRVELKNINSFAAIKRAIQNEVARQQEILKNGGNVQQETRMRDDAAGESTAMRKKAEELDYRYFPDPDLPRMEIGVADEEFLENVDFEIPADFVEKCRRDRGFQKEFVYPLIGDPALKKLFAKFLAEKFAPKLVAKWLAGPVQAWVHESVASVVDFPVSFENFVEFLRLAEEQKFRDGQLKQIFAVMIEEKSAVDVAIQKLGFGESVDDSAMDALVAAVVAEFPEVVAQRRGGKSSSVMFLVGQVMKRSGGKTDPNAVREKLESAMET